MEFKQPPNLSNDVRDGNENGKNVKGFRLTKECCMCIVLFCSFPCRCCTTRKRFSYFSKRKIRQHFTNWKWLDKMNRLRVVSLFSWSVKQNARDTQMTMCVTEGARRERHDKREFKTMWMRIYFFNWQFCCDHCLGCSSSLILVSHYWTIGAKPQKTVREGGLSCGSIWNLIIAFLCQDHLKIPFTKNLQSRFALISFCINHLVLVWLCCISLCCTNQSKDQENEG